jgi:SulP family sulfate permease
VWQLVVSVDQINAWTAALGVGCLAALLLLRRLVPLAPAALLVIVAATFITGLLGLDQRGVSTVGAISGGLPVPAVPDVSLSEVLTLLPVSLALAVIGYAESASVAQDFATHRKYTISPDRELIALGGANALSGFLQAFMVAGGASQSAANDRAGARSQVASLVVAGLALLTALFLTPLFFYLPNAALAAIVISAVLGFFRASDLARIRQLRRDSFAIALIALGGVLLLGMLSGLLLAILLSILIVLTRIARPTVSELGLIPNRRTFVDLDSEPEAAPLPGVLTLRPNALLLFMNVRWVRSLVLARATEIADHSRLRAVLLDLGMSSNLDIEDVDTPAELRSSLRDEGVHLWLGNVRPRARAALERSGYLTDAPGLVQPELQTYVDIAGGGE